jgi:hypothetical protein
VIIRVENGTEIRKEFPNLTDNIVLDCSSFGSGQRIMLKVVNENVDLARLRLLNRKIAIEISKLNIKVADLKVKDCFF